MSTLKRTLAFATPLALVLGALATWNATSLADAPGSDETFKIVSHDLLPHPGPDRHVAYGRVDPDELLEQPIAYSHKLHAGDLQIDCQYCHSMARRSIHAGVPPTQTCMNCHAMIDTTDRPELVKLKEYWDKGEPIPWMKVHDLPDFVYFSHKRHIRGGLDCTECHGDVAGTMTQAQRVKPLNMGWCLDCHKNHKAVDDNYGAQAELRRAELKDCYTCHK